jgi:putative DNA primase/helicase
VDEAAATSTSRSGLLVELPGILNWALDGLDRLNRRGRLDPAQVVRRAPGAAVEPCRRLSRRSSSSTAASTRTVPSRRQLLFDVWKYWCTKTNTMPGNEVHFARDLYAAVSNVKSSRRTEADGKKVQYYAGIGLNPEGTEIAAAISYAQQMTQQFMPRDGDDSGQG